MIKKHFTVLILCITFNVFAAERGPAIKDYPFEKIGDNTWVMYGPLGLPNAENQGFMNNPCVVVSSAGLILVDPGSSVQSGEMVLRMLSKVSDKPVVAVFNSHIHGDHWLGNHAIKAAYPNAKIYGHANMLAEVKVGKGEEWIELMSRLTEGATDGTEVVAPDHAVKHGDVIKIGNMSFRIHHYGIAHTNTDIMVEAIEESVVFLGDNVLSQRIPRMGDGNFIGSIETIDKILTTNAKTYVPNHGPSGGEEVVKEYQQYLKLIYQSAKKAFDEDLDSSDVKKFSLPATQKYKNWVNYEDEVYRHGAQAYMEIEAAEF